MDDLIAFLKARLDEAAADPDVHTAVCGHEQVEQFAACECGLPGRVLADIEAKRKVVDLCAFLLETRQVQEAKDELTDYSRGRAQAGGSILRQLALPFSSHPDYREEWKP